jgi:putative hydrolase of the HAD superfamily
MIRAVIFDFDGLIIDTESPWYEAYRTVYLKYDVELPLEVWAQCIGTSFDVFDPIQYLRERSKQTIERGEILQQTRQLYHSLMKETTIRPGVRQYLSDASEMGLHIGLASSSRREWIESYLGKHDLRDYFEAISTSDDVTKVKPDPELYLRTMHSLQVSGEETIAFEDSLNGLRAAKGAGAFCVVVPNQVTSFMNFATHDLRLVSMEEMSIHRVIESLQRK